MELRLRLRFLAAILEMHVPRTACRAANRLPIKIRRDAVRWAGILAHRELLHRRELLILILIRFGNGQSWKVDRACGDFPLPRASSPILESHEFTINFAPVLSSGSGKIPSSLALKLAHLHGPQVSPLEDLVRTWPRNNIGLARSTTMLLLSVTGQVGRAADRH